MANGEDDILFRIGFLEHPESERQLAALASAVEATQARMSESVGKFSQDFSKTVETVRSQAAQAVTVSAGAMATAQRTNVAPPTAASTAPRSMVPINRSEVERYYREDIAMREELAKAEQRQTAVSREMSEARRILAQEESRILSEARQQILRDIEMVNQAESRGGAAQIGVSEVDVSKARERIAKVYEFEMDLARQAQKARGDAAREAGLKVQAALGAERKAVEQGRAALQKRLEAYKADKAALAKAAADAAKEQERAAKIAEKIRQDQLKQAQTAAKQAAEAVISQYDKEKQAGQKAADAIAQSRGKLIDSFQGSAEAVGKLARSVVLLGIAEADELETALKALAKVQAVIDATTGTISLLKNLGSAFSAIRTITVATAAAKTAEARAGDIATASAARLKVALDAEALSAGNAARAHAMLAAARNSGGAGGAGSAVANAGRFGVAGRIGGAVASGATSLVGAAGARLGGGLLGSGLSSAAAGGLGGIAALGAAALAAAGGLALAGKSAYEFAKEASTKGVGGGATVGGFTDTVGGARFNPFSALIAWSERADAAQRAELGKRAAISGQILAIEIQKEKKLQDIELSMVAERERMRSQMEFDAAQENIARIRDPEARAKAQAADIVNRRAQVTAASQGLDKFKMTDSGSGKETFDLNAPGAEAAFQTYEAANENLINSIKARQQAERDASEASKAGVMEQIKGIEDLIRTRQDEKKAIEDSLKSAKERFGDLSVAEQAATKRAIERARQGQDLTKKDLQRVERIGSAETDRLVSAQRNRSADRGGFDALGLDRTDIAEKDKAINQGIDELSQKTGQSRQDIEKRAANPKIELIDRTEFIAKLDLQEDAIFDALTAEIRKAKEEMRANLERRLQAMSDSEKESARVEAARRVAEAQAGSS